MTNDMTNDIFREILTEKNNIISRLNEIENEYREKKHPGDFFAQMTCSFEIEDIEADEEFGWEYKFLGERYSELIKTIATYVRNHRWQVSIWNDENPFGEQNIIIGNYADKNTAWEIAKTICGTVHYDDSVPDA